jgi:hypothetical protein
MDVLLTIVDPDKDNSEDLDIVEITFTVADDVNKVLGVTYSYDGEDFAAGIIEALAAVKPLGGRVVRVMGRNGASDAVECSLVGVSEYAEIKDVSRQYASNRANMKGFPAREAYLGIGPVWEQIDVLRFERDYQPARGGGRRRRGR